jgi:hypothetical protein
MLMPKDGHFICEQSDCDFGTCDIFEFLDHCGIEYSWGVRLNKRYSFDLFEFLSILSEIIDDEDLEGAYDHIQSATLMMVNASGDDLDAFIHEAVVQSEMSSIMDGIEGLLKEND